MTATLYGLGWLMSFGLLLGCNSQTSEADAMNRESGEGMIAGSPGNQLVGELSPYLLRHASNPVDWMPWGDEAFARAKRENKPVFLSVGYSSCYWCHVMEELVFSDKDIASYMNENFVCIKVDREERPDVDELYMNSLFVYNRMINDNSGGGWPLSMFLTTEGKPFAGGTYFPPKDDARSGKPGFPTVLKGVVEIWNTRQTDLQDNAEVITQQVRQMSAPAVETAGAELNRSRVSTAVTKLLDTYDSQFGGFGFDASQPSRPKFPSPVKLAFLQSHARPGTDAARAVEQTLDSLTQGGVRDHLAGGFHRYSTDREWHVPHFEKMLYDQALLSRVFLRSWVQTRNESRRRITEETLNFVLRELTESDGVFHCSVDAQTDGIEGEYYCWTEEQIREALSPADADLFLQCYDLTGDDVLESGSVLVQRGPLESIARRESMPVGELERTLAHLKSELVSIRQQRTNPRIDDKVLVSWNGLMIRALADAGRVLDRRDYIAAAERAARFITTRMRDENGHLHRSWRTGRSHVTATLDDYAYLVDGILALHSATGNTQWLNAARRLTDDQIAQFHDAQNGGFNVVSKTSAPLIATLKPGYDSVLPSANGVTIMNLQHLAALTDDSRYRQIAIDSLRTFDPVMKKAPQTAITMVHALADHFDPPAEPQSGYSNALATNTPIPPALDSTNDFPSPPPFTPDPTDELARNLIPNPVPQPTVDPSVPETPPLPTIPAPVLPEPSSPAVVRNNDTTLAQGGPGVPAKPKKPPVVKAQAFFSSRTLPAGGTVDVLIKVSIKKGWHINANVVKQKFLKPTVFTVKSQLNSRLTAVAYPKGHDWVMKELNETLSVYEGDIMIRGRIAVPANAGGQTENLELQLTYQACNDNTCMQPKTLPIRGAIPVSPAGQAVVPVNQHLFKE